MPDLTITAPMVQIAVAGEVCQYLAGSVARDVPATIADRLTSAGLAQETAHVRPPRLSGN